MILSAAEAFAKVLPWVSMACRKPRSPSVFVSKIIFVFLTKTRVRFLFCSRCLAICRSSIFNRL